MIVLNAAGIETEVDDWLVRQLQADGEWNKYETLPTIRRGTGPKERVAYLVQNNGIGDDIHAMPAVYQKIRDGYTVDVYGREFTRLCYESVGATFYPYAHSGAANVRDLLPQYGSVYCLSQWCMRHEHETAGLPTESRFEQFARYTETTLPERFDWRDTLHVGERVYGGIVTALHATSPHRSYPLAASLYNHLTKTVLGRNIVRLGDNPNEYKCKTFPGLLALIDAAALVISVDTGPLAIALALGTPCIALLGGTYSGVVTQFEKYAPHLAARCTVMRGQSSYGCSLPCSFQTARGFDHKKRCKSYAECMADIDPAEIVRYAHTYIGDNYDYAAET